MAVPLSRLGLGTVLAGSPSDLPADAAAQERAIAARPREYATAADEVSLYHESLEQAQALTSFGDKPLVVLTTTDAIHNSPGWEVAQDELARLSTNSSHRVVETSHEGLLVIATGSDASIRAILDVVRAVETNQRVRE